LKFLRLATQVQARTQQQAATKGQSRNLLVNAHGRNLAALRSPLQGTDLQGIPQARDQHRKEPRQPARY
jgi:hypothetical protein